MTAPVEEIAEYSFQLALARAYRVPFAPFLLNIRGTFTDPDVNILPSVALEGGQTRISQLAIVDSLYFTIDQPESFDGNIFKPQSDYYSELQGIGIQAKINVDGAPRYAVAPFFTPLPALSSMIANAFPMGWQLGNTQNIWMEYQATIPLQSLPTTVTTTLRMWTPVGTDVFVSMTSFEAYNKLVQIYSDDADMLKTLARINDAPVGR
jgi:hypothetical protein